MDISEAKKKRRRIRGGAFGPFFGPVGGPSRATNPPFQPTLKSPPGSSVSSPAMPGPGGINSPGVAAGPNSGMGAVTASIEPNGYWFSPAALMDDVQLIAQIGSEDE